MGGKVKGEGEEKGEVMGIVEGRRMMKGEKRGSG